MKIFKYATLSFIILTLLSPAALAGDKNDTDKPARKGKGKPHHGMNMLRSMQQEMVQDAKYLYVLRGPQLLKILKKDLSIEAQTLLLPERIEQRNKGK